MGAVPLGRKNEFDDNGGDFYPTPVGFTQALVDLVDIPDRVWECACGDGAMAKVLIAAGSEVYSTDLFDHGYGDIGGDFLTAPLPEGIRSVVTNPPFFLALEFVERGLYWMEQGKTEFLALLLPIHFAGSLKRWDRLFSHPGKRPSKVLVISNRMVLTGADGKRHSSNFNHCWYVWEKSKHNTQLSWTSFVQD